MTMNVDECFKRLMENYAKNPYPLDQARNETLKQLKTAIKTQASRIAEAINSDFSHRSKQETYLLEVFPVINAIDYCIKNTKKWMKERKRKVPIYFKPAYVYLSPQPLGVVGIVVPWNYPLFLALVPLAYAVAAGNHVMVKMSELTPKTGEILQDLIRDAGLQDKIEIINGDVDVSKKFVSLPFGHLLFTGSTEVGKQVMKSASENLTPVTLELGGKSPAVISKTAKKDHLKRLFLGKLLNAGQTCIAPDYLYIHQTWEDQIEAAFSHFLKEHYPDLIKNPDYSSIISEDHQQRLLNLLKDADKKGAKIIELGKKDEQNRRLPQYLILNPTENMKIMQEELFGPIIPVMTYQHFDEVIKHIHSSPQPLSLYYFGEHDLEIKQLKESTLSGALVINDTVMHSAIDDLPFGGVGNSGMGRYHGIEGFDTFSHIKPVFVQRSISPVSWLYPPYGRLLNLFLKKVAGIKLKNKK